MNLIGRKLWPIANRGSRKAFRDAHALPRHGVLLAEAQQRYRGKSRVQDAMPVPYGLAYFDEAENQPMPKMLVQEEWGRMKSAIQRWTREAAT